MSNSALQFVQQHAQAYLDGELPDDLRHVFDQYLGDPHAHEYFEIQQAFNQATHKAMNTPIETPQGLRERVISALDRAEALDHEAEIRELPVRTGRTFELVSSALLVAASLIFVVGLSFFWFDNGNTDDLPQSPQPTQLSQSVAPFVQTVSFASYDGPCHYKDACAVFRDEFGGDPKLLPHTFGADGQCKLVRYECASVNGHKVMSAVYETADGRQFALLILRCQCLPDAEKNLNAAEFKSDGRDVVMWRRGEFFHFLVGSENSQAETERLRQRAEALRDA